MFFFEKQQHSASSMRRSRSYTNVISGLVFYTIFNFSEKIEFP